MRLQLGIVSACTIHEHVCHWYLIRSCEFHLVQGFAVYPNSRVCWIWEHCISYSDGQWVVHRVLLCNKIITTLNIGFLQSSGTFLGSFKLCMSAMYLLQSRPICCTHLPPCAHNCFGYLARYISPLESNHSTLSELTLCCVGRVSCTRNSATLLASMSERGDVVGASSTVCITGIYTSLRQSRQLLSLQWKKKVRRDKMKRRSRGSRLKGREGERRGRRNRKGGLERG